MVNSIKSPPTKGFCQVKNIKNPRKTRKWVGGSSPNSYFNFLGEILSFSVFFVLFSCFQMFQKKKKNGIGGWVGVV